MQQLPWTSDDLVRVVQQGGVRESASKVGLDLILMNIGGEKLTKRNVNGVSCFDVHVQWEVVRMINTKR